MDVNYLMQILIKLGISVEAWLNLDDDEVEAILAMSIEGLTADLILKIEALIS